MAVKATRMGLLSTKRKLKLAKKGHKLLKEKRDALVMEFFSTLKEIKSFRKELGNSLRIAEASLQKAEALQGIPEIERIALGSGKLEYEFSSKNVMGVKLLEIKNVEIEKGWHGYIDSSPELDNSIMHYREILPTLLKLSAKQLALERLAEEIKKTKRKVNSLEFILIPRLDSTKDFITLKLEEFERENFIRLKKIKDRAA
jgi:V/A-type H+/Na+-transporting ATPase subunit D